jgi:predicted nucleotidyltransferase
MAPESFSAGALSDFIKHLNDQSTNYALAGGWAFSALVEPRATTDIDLVILIENPSVSTIAQLFASAFESVVPHPAPMTFKGQTIWRLVGIRQECEVVVDLLLAESKFLQQALSRKKTIEFLGLPVPLLTLEDLILLKLLAGRLQDRADLEKIDQRRADLQVDWEYVQRWKTMLGIP